MTSDDTNLKLHQGQSMTLQFKPVIFVILCVSLMSLAVTNILQQQTAMAKPKFGLTPLGLICGKIWDTLEHYDELWDVLWSKSEINNYLTLLFLWEHYCQDTYGPYEGEVGVVRHLPPDLKGKIDKLLDTLSAPTDRKGESKVPQKDLMDDLRKGITNTTKKNADSTKVP